MAGATGVAVTATVTGSRNGGDSAAVTAATSPCSPIDSGASATVSAGSSSSSVIVTVTGAGAPISAEPVTVAPTSTCFGPK